MKRLTRNNLRESNTVRGRSVSKWKSLRHVRLFVIPWTIQSMDSSGQNTGVGIFSHLQGIFPTQGSNLGLLHCMWILYHLSHKGSPRMTGEGSLSLLQRIFPTRNWTGVSCIACGFFTNWTIRKPLEENKAYLKWLYQWLHSVLLSSALSVRVNCASHLYHTGLSYYNNRHALMLKEMNIFAGRLLPHSCFHRWAARSLKTVFWRTLGERLLCWVLDYHLHHPLFSMLLILKDTFGSLYFPLRTKKRKYFVSLSLSSSFYLVIIFVALGLPCCVQIFTSRGEQGLLSC